MNTTKDYAPETKSLLQRMLFAGFTITAGNNGETFPFDPEKLDEFVAEATACDDAHVHFRTPSGRKGWVYLVLGNEPGVIAADYFPGSCPVLDAVTEEHYQEWSNREQPTKISE